MLKTDHILNQCPECGHTKFKHPANMQDDDFVKCEQCGFEIMLADLKEIGIAQAREMIMPEAKKWMHKMIKKHLKRHLR